MEYEVVIGLEVHIQLATESKIFCSAPACFGSTPNQNIDPLTFGLPGALPVLNKKVVENAILLGLALNCDIRPFNRFARKHYFYPDLPKGYQISQFEEPICTQGHLDIQVNDEGATRTIGITRIHMEEDAGKNIHEARTNSSLIDLNRAGVPLLEIVSEPDLRSPAQAASYLKALRQIVRFLGISDGNMEEGSLRCDANISLRQVGALEFGTRTEIKNMNSFRFVERALEYEVARQLSILKSDKDVVQETRLFDSDSGTTKAMRGKEESSDYRYFPDPDLPPIVIEQSWIESLRASMPKLSHEYHQELVDDFGLNAYDAGVLSAERSYVEYFMKTYETCSNAKAACNWIASELFGLLRKDNIEFEDSPVSAEGLGELIKLVDAETINGKMAKTIFIEMFDSGKSANEIIEAKGLKQITDDEEIIKLIQQAFDENPSQAEEFLGGSEKLHGFFVGQVMKASRGNANPKKVNELLLKEIERRLL